MSGRQGAEVRVDPSRGRGDTCREAPEAAAGGGGFLPPVAGSRASQFGGPARQSGPNRSAAVMQQRVEAHDSLDDFPTPPWAARALCTHVLPAIGHRPDGLGVVWEPAANRGHLLRGLGDHFGRAIGTDVHDYSGEAVMPGIMPGVDFLFPGSEAALPPHAELDWIITNPPFRLAADFVRRGLALRPRGGVAMFLRSAFAEGQERYETLFRPHPPRAEAQFTERVVLHKGVLRRPGSRYLDPETGKEKSATTATAYAWFVWTSARPDFCERLWIPPCRAMLERPGDYPEAAPGTDAAELFA